MRERIHEMTWKKCSAGRLKEFDENHIMLFCLKKFLLLFLQFILILSWCCVVYVYDITWYKNFYIWVCLLCGKNLLLLTDAMRRGGNEVHDLYLYSCFSSVFNIDLYNIYLSDISANSWKSVLNKPNLRDGCSDLENVSNHLPVYLFLFNVQIPCLSNNLVVVVFGNAFHATTETLKSIIEARS